MLIKKLLRKIKKNYLNKNKYDDLGWFVFSGQKYFIVRPKNVISKTAYVVPEKFTIRKDIPGIKYYLRSNNKFRGRSYVIC